MAQASGQKKKVKLQTPVKLIARLKVDDKLCSPYPSRKRWLRTFVVRPKIGSRTFGYGLFVLLAAAPAPVAPSAPNEDDNTDADASAEPKQPASATKPVYGLFMTDQYGYLSPIASAPEPNPDDDSTPPSRKSKKILVSDNKKTIKIFPDTKYLVYFILHPDEAKAREIMDAVNGGDTAQAGDPFELMARKSRMGKHYEAHLEMQEDHFANFLPSGGELYGGMTLFRHMPLQHCTPVQEQIYRLQVHLGAFRYPVGTQAMPYHPSKQFRGEGHHTTGLFDPLTFNGVLAFQRDAMNGNMFKLSDPAATLHRHVRIDQNYAPWFPLGDFSQSGDCLNHFSESAMDFLKGTPTSSGVVFEGNDDGIVDDKTADAIKGWLDKGMRRGGKILLPYKSGHKRWWYEWMREEAHTQVTRWSTAAKKLGFEPGIMASHCFRDIRAGAGYGSINTSIHKIGLAIDIALKGGSRIYTVPHPEFRGLHYVWEEKDRGGRVYWRIYGESSFPKEKILELLPKCDPPLDASVLVHRISPWKYDYTDPHGGGPEPHLSGNFLDLTAIALKCNMHRIGSYRKGWQGHPDKIQLRTPADYRKLAGQIEQLDKGGHGGSLLMVEGQSTTANPLALVRQFDTKFMADWIEVMEHHDYRPNPLVAVTPMTSEVEKLKLQVLNYFPTKFFWVTTPLGAFAARANQFDWANVISICPWFHEAELTLLPGNTVNFVTAGIPKGMEWWHFQNNETFKGKLWCEMLYEIGWTEEGLLAAGYSKKTLKVKAA